MYCKKCNAIKTKEFNLNKTKEVQYNWYHHNGGKDKVKNYKNEHLLITREREYKNDLQYRLRKILRTRIKKFINGEKKTESSKKLLGCDTFAFIEWINYQINLHKFENMNWNNYGEYWNIDQNYSM